MIDSQIIKVKKKIHNPDNYDLLVQVVYFNNVKSKINKKSQDHNSSYMFLQCQFLPKILLPEVPEMDSLIAN